VFIDWSLLLSLLALLNPIVIGLLYLGYKPKASLLESVRDGVTVCIGSTALMLIMISTGTRFLDFLGVDLLSIRVAGGLVLLLSVYSLMSESVGSSDSVSRVQGSASRGIVTPFVTPIYVGGASISLLFNSISLIPELTPFVFFRLGLTVFLAFAIISVFFPVSVLLLKRFNPDILVVIKSISLFFVFSIGVKILISTLPEIADAVM
jgi:small neutral amino acid transporter SnatA (MarC family)